MTEDSFDITYSIRDFIIGHFKQTVEDANNLEIQKHFYDSIK